jgi:hypothetical protein
MVGHQLWLRVRRRILRMRFFMACSFRISIDSHDEGSDVAAASAFLPNWVARTRIVTDARPCRTDIREDR